MSNTSLPQITRLAPSPTGALHLGNARTFLINWILARQNGWRILLRIEDLDGPRVKPQAAGQLIDDLHWLGLDWDGEPIYQSQRAHCYAAAIERLLDAGLAYPCICTRTDIARAASAPHAAENLHSSDAAPVSNAGPVSHAPLLADGAAIYPGVCRGRFHDVREAAEFTGKPPAIRFAAPDETIVIDDLFAGVQQFNAARDLGDFVIAKSDGTAAYQLAVVVDDAEMAVTHVVRGDDLLDSAARQMLLYRALGMSDRIPKYLHVPLVVGPDGRRLAKRHGDSRLSAYRAAGVTAGRIRALLGRWCGIPSAGDTLSIAEFLEQFSLNSVPRQPIRFTETDHRWLFAESVLARATPRQ